MPSVYFVRHFLTQWNQEGRLQGVLDLPLANPEKDRDGAQMAQNLAQLSVLKNPRVFCSPLERARHTAQLHGFAKPVIDDRFLELNFGQIEGLTKVEVEQKFPGKWLDSPQDLPLGETFSSFVLRVSRACDLLREDPSRDTIIFGHGAWFRCFKCVWTGKAPETMNQMTVKNGELQKLLFTTLRPVEI